MTNLNQSTRKSSDSLAVPHSLSTDDPGVMEGHTLRPHATDVTGGHLPRWNLDIVTIVVIVGVAIKSTFVSMLILGWGGVLTGFPVAIWLALAYWLAARLGEQIYRVFLFSTSAGLGILLYADVLHVRGFGSTLDIISAAGSPTLSGLGPSIVALMRPWDIFLFLDIFMAVFLAYAPKRSRKLSVVAPRKRFSYPVIAGVVVFMALSSVRVMEIPISPHQHLAGVGPVGVHVTQVLSKVPWSQYSLKQDERDSIESWLDRNAVYADASAEYEHLYGVLDGRDTYLIVVESLEGGVIDLKIQDQEVTPYLNSILSRSLVFPNIVQQTRDGNTSDAELMLLTGMYPLQSGSVFLKNPDTRFSFTLPNELSERGYSTTAIHGDTANFWNRQFMFPHLGFDEYISEHDFAARPEIGMGIADESLFDQALIERERVAQPAFMMLTTLTSHFPWSMPTGLKGLDLPGDDDLTAGYLQSVNYVDQEIGNFVEQLEDRGLLQQSAFVIVGDHEGIHKYDSRGTWLEDNKGKLPFIVFIPGVEGDVVDNPGGQVDILPTLAHLFGIPSHEIAGRVMGRNLLGVHHGSTIHSDGQASTHNPVDELLQEAQHVSDMALRGDYFADAEHVESSGP